MSSTNFSLIHDNQVYEPGMTSLGPLAMVLFSLGFLLTNHLIRRMVSTAGTIHLSSIDAQMRNDKDGPEQRSKSLSDTSAIRSNIRERGNSRIGHRRVKFDEVSSSPFFPLSEVDDSIMHTPRSFGPSSAWIDSHRNLLVSHFPSDDFSRTGADLFELSDNGSSSTNST